MSEIILREYRDGDWRAMYALDVACFVPPFRFTRRAMREFAEADGAIAVLAETDAQLAGFCIAHIEEVSNEGQQGDDRTGYVVTLDIDPAWRRRGLARRLMQELETRVQAAGAQSMMLHVFPGNVAAIKLYEALEYEPTGVAEDFYGSGFDALVYCKALVSPRSLG